MQIDTHALIKILEKANFKEEQAEAIVAVITKSQAVNVEQIDLAIKETQTISNIANSTKEKLEGVATKEFVRAEIATVRTEIEAVRTEIKSQYIKFTGLVFTMIIALKILTPYFDKFL